MQESGLARCEAEVVQALECEIDNLLDNLSERGHAAEGVSLQDLWKPVVDNINYPISHNQTHPAVVEGGAKFVQLMMKHLPDSADVDETRLAPMAQSLQIGSLLGPVL